MAIIVERDRSVVVRAPTGTDPQKIAQIVQARKRWIYQKINHAQKYKKPPPPPGKELVNGESMLYLGYSYLIELVDSDGQIQLAQKFLVPRQLVASCGDQPVFQEWYLRPAHQQIPMGFM